MRLSSNAYSASKGALNTLVRCWHRELKGETYVAICPGWVRTDMGGEGAPRSVEKGAQTPVWALTVPDLPGGLFYRDRQPISW
ncbi:MAG: SDR family NAD(P)-dependent oxidoreductase [Spirochaetales bacterium]|nr:SDR family NAD(P)-dependent oxidoreductase [Spirochaetales bacterium]